MRWQHKNPSKWHRWFAWHPIQIDNTEEWVWMETIERKLVTNWWDDCWFYREVKCTSTDTQ